MKQAGFILLCIAALGGFAPMLGVDEAFAQSEVRAWNADGQTWIIWRGTEPTPFTYDVYASDQPIANPADAELIGRLFREDWTAARLKLANPAANWRAPDASRMGPRSYYTLADDEALFVSTPHAEGARYFAVVKHGETAIGPDNTAGPTPERLDPVQCHPQVEGISENGRNFTVMAHWVDGQDDFDGGRSDYPVMGNRNANGIGFVFAVFDPENGRAPGRADLPAVIVMHGGAESNYYRFGCGDNPNFGIEMRIPDGFLVSVDDSIHVLKNVWGAPAVDPEPTRWFGYWEGFDRFTLPAQAPPDDALIVDYTQRRLDFIVDWLGTRGGVDPDRVSLLGLSGGGAGAGFAIRRSPSRYAAAMEFVPTFIGTPFPFARFMQGRMDQNLRTNLPGDIGVADYYWPTTLVSDEDLPLYRCMVGKHDWYVDWEIYVDAFDQIDAQRFGAQLYWDEREHVTKWGQAHWFKDPRLDPASLTRFRASASFPAFSHTNAGSNGSGRLPDIGRDGRESGDPWGTWGGWCDFDETDVTDEPDRWAATVFLVSESDFPADVPDFDALTSDVTVRRATHFRPNPGARLSYTLTGLSDDAFRMEGIVTVSDDGLVTVEGLSIRKQPARLEILPRDDGSDDDDADDDDTTPDFSGGDDDDGDNGCCG